MRLSFVDRGSVVGSGCSRVIRYADDMEDTVADRDPEAIKKMIVQMETGGTGKWGTNVMIAEATAEEAPEKPNGSSK